VRHTLSIQLVTALVLAAGAAVGFGLSMAGAVLYGGSVAMLAVLIQHRYALRAEQVAGLDPGRNLRLLLRCELERLLLAAVLLAIGLTVLRLPALTTLLTFVLVSALQVLGTNETLVKRWRATRKP
jgi:hypothetical protein